MSFLSFASAAEREINGKVFVERLPYAWFPPGRGEGWGLGERDYPLESLVKIEGQQEIYDSLLRRGKFAGEPDQRKRILEWMEGRLVVAGLMASDHVRGKIEQIYRLEDEAGEDNPSFVSLNRRVSVYLGSVRGQAIDFERKNIYLHWLRPEVKRGLIYAIGEYKREKELKLAKEEPARQERARQEFARAAQELEARLLAKEEPTKEELARQERARHVARQELE